MIQIWIEPYFVNLATELKVSLYGTYKEMYTS